MHSERTRKVVEATLEQVADPELSRGVVADAIVSCRGTHYTIVCGAESEAELDAQANRMRGRCACGGVLSLAFDRFYCRACERTFPI